MTATLIGAGLVMYLMYLAKYSVLWPTEGKRGTKNRRFRPIISLNFAVLHWQWWRLHISEIPQSGFFCVAVVLRPIIECPACIVTPKGRRKTTNTPTIKEKSKLRVVHLYISFHTTYYDWNHWILRTKYFECLRSLQFICLKVTGNSL